MTKSSSFPFGPWIRRSLGSVFEVDPFVSPDAAKYAEAWGRSIELDIPLDDPLGRGLFQTKSS